MIVDSNITNILSFPTPHSHPEESLDDLTMEKIRQKMKKRLKKDPTQNLKNVFDNVLEENPRQLATDYRSIRSSLYRIRAKKFHPSHMRYFFTFTKIFFRYFSQNAYLPPAQVCPKMADFCSRPTTQLLVSIYPGFAEILRYFHRTWVCTFPISMWNVFNRKKK